MDLKVRPSALGSYSKEKGIQFGAEHLIRFSTKLSLSLNHDAKVRIFFEPPKLFEVFFENYFFQSARSKTSSLYQYFNSSAFLSRKRVQNYCFTAYTPNLHNTFLPLFSY